MQLCTIAARNYLAHARVLTRSFLQHHPESIVTVLLVDGVPGDGLTDDDAFETVYPEQIALEAEELRQMRAIYDVTEFSTAVKPALLEHLVAGTAETVLYLDPDCEVHGHLGEVDELTVRHSLVVTPHVTSPLPRDGLLIDEQVILWSGIFNLGFIAVSTAAVPFLRWWKERTRFDAIKAPQQGVFTDQRWVDFVPALFRHHVLRDPGYNVAYWNLFERPLVRGPEGALTAGGAPLRFFHFSGYDPDRPHMLSVHQGDRPRARLSDLPVVAELCDEYGASLRRADFDRLKRLTYRFSGIASGPLDVSVRRIVRTALLEPDEPEPPDPFDADGDAAFVDWLNEPVISVRGATVTRLHLGIWRERADLQAAFPEVVGAGARKLVGWAKADRDFLQMFGHLDRSSDRRVAVPRRRTPAPGFNVVGYFDAELGMGEAGRLMVRAVEHAGVPLTTHVYRRTRSRQSGGYVLPDTRGSTYDISLFCVNADSVSQLVAELDPPLTNGPYRVGLWFWEVDEFPRSMRSAFDEVDEVWVASEFVREAIGAHTRKPVHLFPLPIVADPPSYLRRSTLGLPDRFLFLFCYDAFSVPERKNPVAVVDAFKTAFAVEDGAFLLVKSINAGSDVAELDRVHRAIGDRPDIRFVDDYWPSEWMRAVTQLCDCYVSLHRSEGLGLTLAAAMTQGKPVIATGYSGNLEFMDDSNSLLVPYEIVRVGPGHAPYPASARWAEPDVGAAAELMRRVHDDRSWAAEVGRSGRASVADSHGLERSAEAVRAHFDRILISVLDARLAL